MDKIILKGLRFYGKHGVMEHERELGQVFEVDLEMSVDLRQAGLKDDLSLSVNYAEVFDLVEEVVTGKPHFLLEAVAERIAGLLLERCHLVQAVRVLMKKPSAPVKGLFEYMAVEINRTRELGIGN